MKKLYALGLAASVVLLAGCFVVSVHPYYTPEGVVFDPALNGRWSNTEQEWQFAPEPTEEKAYRIIYKQDGRDSIMGGHLFKLEGHLFLDLLGQSDSETMPPPIPSHYLFRVDLAEDGLKLTPLHYDWLKELLVKEPKTLRHNWRVNPGDKPEDRYFVLTAETDELQKFILKHLKTADAWGDSLELKRATER